MLFLHDGDKFAITVIESNIAVTVPGRPDGLLHITDKKEDSLVDRISIVVPCYNEEETLDYFYGAIKELGEKLEDAELEIIFVDDGSKDHTYEKMCALHEKDSRIKCISFSRNFGKEAAIFSGLRGGSGDCFVVMDADLQHPPETILQMYAYWKEGYEVVEGIKETRGKESGIHKCLACMFYGAISKIMHVDMRNSSDFKLMDKKVAAAVCALTEKNTFFRALAYWVGFKSITVTYEVHERVAGKTKWSYWKLGTYALKNLTSFTNAPLQIVTVIGVLFLLLGVIWGVDAILSSIQGRAVGGYPSLVLLIVIATGGIMVSLGIIGAYIAKIYDEIKNRPQYIIREKKD